MHPVQIVFILICLVLLAFPFLWIAGQIAQRSQKRQAFSLGPRDDYVTMPAEPAPSSAVVSQTDQTPDQTDSTTPKVGREELLTLYRLMREGNIARESARRALRGVGVPLDNNLWADAAPPRRAPLSDDEEEIVTPYAGRRTKAAYYPDDPDLEFQAPA